MKYVIVIAFVLLVTATYLAVAAGGRMLGDLKSEFRSVEVGELKTETESVDLGAARSVQAEFHVGCGSLNLRGGADQLMDATFTYNIPSWKPDVMYGVTGGKGRLSVKQPNSNGNVRGKNRYEWDIRLKDGIPLDLSVHAGVGSTELNLDGLDVTALKVSTGTSGPKVRLTGVYPSLTEIRLDSGVGSASLDLVGRYPALKTVRVNGGTGTVKVDLTGEWKRDAAITVDKGVGKTSLLLPKDVGVRVVVDTGVGKVSGSGMKLAGEKTYVNDAYGRSKVTLEVAAKQGVGDIVLDLEQ